MPIFVCVEFATHYLNCKQTVDYRVLPLYIRGSRRWGIIPIRTTRTGTPNARQRRKDREARSIKSSQS